MLELILAVILVVTMSRIADADGQSPLLWGMVALAVSFLCYFFIPLPFGRMLLAGVITFVAMTAYKMAKK